MLLGALVLAGLISIGLYTWDAHARQLEANLRPQPLAPLAAAPPTSAPPPTTPAVPVAAATGDPTAGKAAFLKTCFGCHPDGNAGIGPALHGPAFSSRYPDNTAIAAVVRGGHGRMPAFSSSLLSDADLENVIAYIRSLPGAQ
jgi:mono/diheme cytochrome c family protein